MPADDYLEAEAAFRANAVDAADDATLRRWLLAFANQPITNEGIQHAAVIRGLTLNHMLLKRHIDALDRKSGVMQRLVIVLTVASVIATTVQTVIAVRAERRASASQLRAAPAAVNAGATFAPIDQPATMTAPPPIRRSTPTVADSSAWHNPKTSRQPSPRAK